MVAQTARQVQPQRKEWKKFYKEVYDLKLNFSNLRIPKYRRGFDQLLVMAEGLTFQRIVETMQKSMKVYFAIDLSRVISDRNPGRTYAIWLRDRQEADVELKNLSADGLKTKGINGITLPERLVYGHFYKWKYGLHLDVRNLTLCSGSRYVDADGGVWVPYVYWGSDYGEVCVHWYYLVGRSCDLRSRGVVS